MALLDYAFLWLAFIGLFAIVNPFSTAIVFLSATGGDSEQQKRKMVKKASIVSAAVIIVFMIFGSIIFNIFSITIEAFMIAGGLIIAKLGFNMLNAKPRQTEKEEKESKRKEDISIIPLAIPMLSGPGAITTALVWTSQAPGIPERIGLLFIPIVISLLAYPIILNAKYLKKVFGHAGINVIEKLMGLIVLVMGVQFIINALIKLIPTIF